MRHQVVHLPAFRLKVVSAGIALMLSAGTSHAQTAAPVEAQRGERVEVTGSNIRRTDTETASPIQVFTRADIEKTGKQNIADVIRGISADSQGSLPTAFSAGFASGASGVSLRGLGLNSTLVLVNGRRMAPYGLADDGARNFVDLNSIPLEAVQRIEILKDGASAIYGSDAVGGVVNIILRSEYSGASVNADAGTSSHGDGTTGRVAGIAGFGDLERDRYNVFGSLEVSRTDHIKATDRSGYLGTNDLRSIGYFDSRRGSYAAGLGNFGDGSGQAFSSTTPYGTVRVPGGTQSQRINLTPCPEINPQTGVCTYDTIGYSEIQPKVDRLNFFSQGTYAFNANNQAYLEVGYFKARTEAVGTPGAVSDGGVYNPADPANPLVVHTTTLSATNPDNPTGVVRTLSLLTTDLGGRNSVTDSSVKRVVGGFKGTVEKIDYDVGAAYIGSDLHQTQTGYVRYSVLQSALDNGTYRVNNPALVPQSLRDAISPKLQFQSQADIKLVDVHLSRPMLDLPGGPLSIAVGGEYRHEHTNKPVVPYTDTSDIVGLGYSAYSGDRSIYAAFGEIDVPLFKWLELNAAVRRDKYSDVGNSTTPKYGLKIKPIDQVAFRASYSEAFRAPGPTEAGNSSSLGFTNIAIVTIGDPSVKPETSKAYGYGFVLEPTRDLSASVDYFHIKRKNEIVGADQAAILGSASLAGDPTLANAVRPGAQQNSFIYYDVDGAVAAVSGPYANANSTITNGLDFNIRHRLDLGAYGKLTTNLNWTHTIGFRRTLKDGTTFEYAGTQGPYVLSSAGGTPKDKGVLSLTYDYGATSGTVQVNYVGPMLAIDHKGETLNDNGDGTFSTTTAEGAYTTNGSQVCGVFYPGGGAAPGGCKIRSFTTTDLFVKYTGVKKWVFTASIQNLFNLKAPFDPYTYGAVNYNPAQHQAGAVGTFFTLGARYTY